MPVSFTMNDRQKQKIGYNILDLDGQRINPLPADAIVDFQSSDPSVLTFTPDAVAADGYTISGDIASGLVGTAVLSGTVTFSDGSAFADTVAGAVTNSAAAQGGFALIGEPTDE